MGEISLPVILLVLVALGVFGIVGYAFYLRSQGKNASEEIGRLKDELEQEIRDRVS